MKNCFKYIAGIILKRLHYYKKKKRGIYIYRYRVHAELSSIPPQPPFYPLFHSPYVFSYPNNQMHPKCATLTISDRRFRSPIKRGTRRVNLEKWRMRASRRRRRRARRAAAETFPLSSEMPLLFARFSPEEKRLQGCRGRDVGGERIAWLTRSTLRCRVSREMTNGFCGIAPLVLPRSWPVLSSWRPTPLLYLLSSGLYLPKQSLLANRLSRCAFGYQCASRWRYIAYRSGSRDILRQLVFVMKKLARINYMYIFLFSRFPKSITRHFCKHENVRKATTWMFHQNWLRIIKYDITALHVAGIIKLW